MFFKPGETLYKGNLHTHTTCSDGKLTPQEVMALYQKNGYDFLALTDHWLRSCDEGFYKNMLLLPGIELDFFLPGQVAHIVGINITAQMAQAFDRKWGPQLGINAIRKCGGAAILAHPQWSLNTPSTIASLKGLVAAEIYNAISRPPWNAERADATNLLDMAGAQGCLLNTVACDDAHHYTGDECHSFIRLKAEKLDAASIVNALRRGDFYASQGPEFYELELEGDVLRISCSPVQRIIFSSDRVWARERCKVGRDMTDASYPLNRESGESFVRVIIEDEHGRKAWANPIPI